MRPSTRCRWTHINSKELRRQSGGRLLSQLAKACSADEQSPRRASKERLGSGTVFEMAERRAIDGPVLLGVDVGTQSIRVLAFSVDGRLLASASRPTPSRPWGEGVDYDPDALFA